MSADPLPLEALVLERRRAYYEGQGDRFQRNQPIASDLDPDSCLRRQVLEVVAWDKKAPPSPELSEKFRAGRLAEEEVMAFLERDLRLKITEQQAPFSLVHQKTGQKVVGGKIDGKLWPDVPRGHVVVEVKRVSPWEFDRIGRYLDLFDRWWTRKWPPQIQLYMVGTGTEHGLFLLTDGARLKPVQVGLDLDVADRAWRHAEAIVDAIELFRMYEREGLQSLPAFTTDQAQCTRCPFFGRACNPPLVEQGARVIADADLESAIERWRELDEPHREHERLDKAIKEALRAGVPREAGARRLLLVGKFAVEVSAVPVKASEKPREARVDLRVSIEALSQ